MKTSILTPKTHELKEYLGCISSFTPTNLHVFDVSKYYEDRDVLSTTPRLINASMRKFHPTYGNKPRSLWGLPINESLIGLRIGQHRKEYGLEAGPPITDKVFYTAYVFEDEHLLIRHTDAYVRRWWLYHSLAENASCYVISRTIDSTVPDVVFSALRKGFFEVPTYSVWTTTAPDACA